MSPITLTKNDLIAAVEGNFSVSNIAEQVFAELGKMLANGYSVNIRGFGTFKVQERAAHATNHPNTGERIVIPAHNVVKFSPCDALKEAVNGR